MTKKIIIFLILMVSNLGISQDLNTYKYAIVPSKFSFLKEKDQYRLNTLTKMFMEKYGFVTFFDTDILPVEVAEYNCNTIFVDVQNVSSLLSTKMIVVLKDCRNTILLTSVQGKSKEKEYHSAYNQALREALNSLDLKNHNFQEDIGRKKPVLMADETFLETTKKPNINFDDTKKNALNESEKLFAKPLGSNLFQLLTNDTDVPRLILTIAKTNNPSIFIVQEAMKQGVVYKKDSEWFLDFYENEKLVSQKLNIINFN